MSGFPDWLTAALAVVLPILYQKLYSKLPGFVKWLVTWGTSAIITVVVGVVFLHYNSPGQFLAAYAWLLAACQFVYQLLVKPAAARARLAKLTDSTQGR